MYEVRLGNENPKQSTSRDENDNPIWEPAPGPSVCYVRAPGDLAEVFVTISDRTGGVWTYQSFDEKPSWVESDSPELAALLGAHYGIPVGAPEDLEDTHHTYNGPPGVDVTTIDPAEGRENYSEMVLESGHDDDEVDD